MSEQGDDPVVEEATVTDKDTPVEGAQPRSDELIDRLDEVKSTPPDTESGNEWPDIGQPGGVESIAESSEDTDSKDPLS